MEATHTFVLKATPAQVWRYISDPTTWQQWMPTVHSVEPADGTTQPAKDATYKLRRKGDFSGELRVTSFIPEREFGYELSGSVTPATGSFTLQGQGSDVVAVTSTLETGPISSAVLAVFAGGKGKVEDQLADDGEGLRSLVETAGSAKSSS